MEHTNIEYGGDIKHPAQDFAPVVILAELAAQQEPEAPPVSPPPARRIWTPVLLFVATCASTYVTNGWVYAVCVMTILLCHEMGHFLQALRYGVRASLPWFIPLPYISQFGTLGAVIGMSSRMGDRRSLFDIGISGPLAGLVPTLIFLVIGLRQSAVLPVMFAGGENFGEPLLLQWLAHWLKGPIPDGWTLEMTSMAFAGWVGLFITSLNLLPIGQLDGGHVLYALMPRYATRIAKMLLAAAIVVVMIYHRQLWVWLAMLILLTVMGPHHPPTSDDASPLSRGRIVLGWLTLAFLIIGFTPVPFIFSN